MAPVSGPTPSYRPYLLMFILNLAIVAGILYLLRREEPRTIIVAQPSPRAGNTGAGVQAAQITVTVSGAVRHPGSFQLDSTARLADALQRAGGVRSEADLSQFDLTGPLRAGETITVPVHRTSPPVANNLVSATPAPTRSPLNAVSHKTNLNGATLEELVALPGIGPALAQRILDYRAAHGNFKAIEEIKEVKGIGDAIFNQLKELVTVAQDGQ